MPSSVSAFKFVGTVSLGLFTGVSYSLCALSLPTLLLLPSAPQAQHAFSSLVRSSTLHLRTLAAVSAVSFPLAFALSPARARHPYLLWTGLVSLLAATPDLLLGQTIFAEHEEVNGETVERAVKSTQITEIAKTGIALAGFAMGVVGLWGDGA